MQKTIVFLLAACSFMAGIVLGFMLSPIKRGIFLCGDNSNNRYANRECWDGDEDTQEDEEDAIPF